MKFVILASETTVFECTVWPSTNPTVVTWLKDNKPLDDQLADRVSIVTEENNTRFRLTMLNSRVEDTGTYTARASNGDCSSTCSAYLLVQECKSKFTYIKNCSEPNLWQC